MSFCLSNVFLSWMIWQSFHSNPAYPRDFKAGLTYHTIPKRDPFNVPQTVPFPWPAGLARQESFWDRCQNYREWSFLFFCNYKLWIGFPIMSRPNIGIKLIQESRSERWKKVPMTFWTSLSSHAHMRPISGLPIMWAIVFLL